MSQKNFGLGIAECGFKTVDCGSRQSAIRNPKSAIETGGRAP
jgi:hypothetical protein